MSALAIELVDAQHGAKPSLHVRTRKEGGDCKLASVYEGGAAHRAGLSAGDTLIAIDGLRVTASNLDALLARYRNGDCVTVHAFRRDELMSVDVTLRPESAPQLSLSMKDKPLDRVKRRHAWLRGRG